MKKKTPILLVPKKGATSYNKPNESITTPNYPSNPMPSTQNPQVYETHSATFFTSSASPDYYQQDFSQNLMPDLYNSQQLDPNPSNLYPNNTISYSQNNHVYQAEPPNLNYPSPVNNPYPNEISNAKFNENPSAYFTYSSNPSYDLNPTNNNSINPPQEYNEHLNNPNYYNQLGSYNIEPPKLIIENTPEPPQPEPQIDYEELKASYIQNLPCTSCGNPQIELFLPGCNHPYHIACFKQYCKVCETPKEILQLKKKAASFCEICQNDCNLLYCDKCEKIFCFLCLFYRIDKNSCCGQIEANLKYYESFCPGCEYIMDYSKFIPIGCKGHSLLCRKCLCLGIMAGKCVQGCKINLNLKEMVRCQACGEHEIGYRGDFECENCIVCYKCQWQNNVRVSKTKEYSCVFCDSPLTPQVKVN